MSVNSKMTALADEIRVLSGSTETMGLDAMKSNVANANDTVDTQADLIAQIASALEGKAGGGSGGGSVETCNVQLSTSAGFFAYITYSHVDSNEVVSTYEVIYSNSINLTNVVCGTFIVLEISSTVGVETKVGAETLGSGVNCWHITANAGETAVLSFHNPF